MRSDSRQLTRRGRAEETMEHVERRNPDVAAAACERRRAVLRLERAGLVADDGAPERRAVPLAAQAQADLERRVLRGRGGAGERRPLGLDEDLAALRATLDDDPAHPARAAVLIHVAPALGGIPTDGRPVGRWQCNVEAAAPGLVRREYEQRRARAGVAERCRDGRIPGRTEGEAARCRVSAPHREAHHPTSDGPVGCSGQHPGRGSPTRRGSTASTA